MGHFILCIWYFFRRYEKFDFNSVWCITVYHIYNILNYTFFFVSNKKKTWSILMMLCGWVFFINFFNRVDTLIFWGIMRVSLLSLLSHSLSRISFLFGFYIVVAYNWKLNCLNHIKCDLIYANETMLHMRSAINISSRSTSTSQQSCYPKRCIDDCYAPWHNDRSKWYKSDKNL